MGGVEHVPALVYRVVHRFMDNFYCFVVVVIYLLFFVSAAASHSRPVMKKLTNKPAASLNGCNICVPLGW